MYYDCVSRFREENPELHTIVNLKCLVANTWHMPFLSSLHLSLSFYLLRTTRFAVLFAPVWAIVLVMYQKYRKESEKATIAMEDEKDLERLEDK